MYHSEDIWHCALYGRVDRLRQLAPEGVTIGADGAVAIEGVLIIELLFGGPYAGVAARAAAADRFSFVLERHDAVRVPPFTEFAHAFLNAAFSWLTEVGETPASVPDFYGKIARTSSQGWPVYFLAVGNGLALPQDSYRGKVGLPG